MKQQQHLQFINLHQLSEEPGEIYWKRWRYFLTPFLPVIVSIRSHSRQPSNTADSERFIEFGCSLHCEGCLDLFGVQSNGSKHTIPNPSTSINYQLLESKACNLERLVSGRMVTHKQGGHDSRINRLWALSTALPQWLPTFQSSKIIVLCFAYPADTDYTSQMPPAGAAPYPCHIRNPGFLRM